MPLWGNKDYATGNQKPLFANTSNISSASTTVGAKANTNKFYGSVFGVSSTEADAVSGTNKKPAHPGWVSHKVGTGPIKGISITGGNGYNSGGYLILTDTSVANSGSGANISYSIANSQNIMEAYSSNAQLNVINSFVINSGGSGWSENSKISVVSTSRGITNSTFSFVLGGRGDRKTLETLVAMGSISEDDPRDNATYSGI